MLCGTSGTARFRTAPNGAVTVLVCVFLHGGNDSFNMLIPSGIEAGKRYSDYADIRSASGLAVADKALSIDLGTNHYNSNQKVETAYLKGSYDLSDKSIPLAVNGVMPELAQLIHDDKASIVANIGTLVQPVTRDEILDKTANLPITINVVPCRPGRRII